MTITMSITVLLRLIFILFLLIIINVVYLVIKKQIDTKGEQIIATYIQDKQLIWFYFFRDGTDIPPELIPRNRYEIVGVEKIFFVYLHNLKTPRIVEKIRQFSNTYLYEHFKLELRSKRWSKRMNAMERILDFEIDRLVEQCVQMDQNKLSSDEQFQRLKIIARLKNQDFICHLRASTYVFSEYEYKRIFMNLPDDILYNLLVDIESFPAVCQYSLIDLVGIKKSVDFLSILDQFIHHPNAEVRIRSLKAIYEIGVVTDINNYKQFRISTVWEERLMFTKMLVYVPSQVAFPYLRQLIKDEAWSVRLQAASVMRKYREGKQMLTEIIETERDPFAVDMANAFLEEGDNQ